jgi:ubiquinone biosynthesis protein COQ9
MAVKKNVKAKAVTTKKAGPSLADRIADMSLEIAAREGWDAVRLDRLGDELGEPFGSVVVVYPTPDRIASTLLRRLDNQVLAQVNRVDDSELPRDRLFEVMMMRFDALQRHRAGYAALISSLSRRPLTAFMRAPSVVHSMALMLIAAGIGAQNPIGVARAHALAIAYASVLRIWLKDDSADMARTMSELDKTLGRLEKIQRMVSGKGSLRKNEDG